MKLLMALLLLIGASPAFAQRTEISLLGGYTTAGNIEKRAAGIQDLEVKGSFTWGLRAGRFFSPHLGVEASWAQQESALRLGTSSGAADLFDMHVGTLQGNLVYQFGADEARFKPFLFGGLGAAFLSAQDLDSETKFSWALGAGLKWYPAKRLGARVQARYAPIQLNDSSSDFCDPFGFCQGSLHQFELMGGMVFRF